MTTLTDAGIDEMQTSIDKAWVEVTHRRAGLAAATAEKKDAEALQP
jgi:hypothetical protein